MMTKICILILGILIISIPALAGAEKPITMDPVGEHANGEKFVISGTTAENKTSKIGIEIMPKEYWENITRFAKEGDGGYLLFREVGNTGDNVHPTGLNLVRFNPDKTQSYMPYNKTSNYRVVEAPVKKNTSGEFRWSAQVNEKENGKSLSPGTYHVNIYNATTEIIHPGILIGNGWDITNQTIYPSTAWTDIWDPRNKKEMFFGEFTIKP